MLSLVANYRHRGWRWKLESGDEIELWEGTTLVGRVSVDLLTQLLLHHLQKVSLDARIQRALTAPLPLPDREIARPALRAMNGRKLRGRT